MGNDAIVEFEDLVADCLGCLVALSGDQHNVTFAGAGDRVADGATTVDFDELRGCIHSRNNRSDDGLWGFTSRVVARDDDPVGESAGDLAHLGPLTLISVAAGAEDDDERPLGDLPGRSEHGLQPVRGVGVVNHDGERLAGVHGLETAGDAPHSSKGGSDVVVVVPKGSDGFGSQRGIGDVEGTGQRE